MGDKTLMIRLIKPATLAAANSAFVIAYVLGNTSAKIKTRIVIINVARAMPLPKVCVNNAVVREVAKMFTKLLPKRTDPINPLCLQLFLTLSQHLLSLYPHACATCRVKPR